jgi:hypothetical protein
VWCLGQLLKRLTHCCVGSFVHRLPGGRGSRTGCAPERNGRIVGHGRTSRPARFCLLWLSNFRKIGAPQWALESSSVGGGLIHLVVAVVLYDAGSSRKDWKPTLPNCAVVLALGASSAATATLLPLASRMEVNVHFLIFEAAREIYSQTEEEQHDYFRDFDGNCFGTWRKGQRLNRGMLPPPFVRRAGKGPKQSTT